MTSIAMVVDMDTLLKALKENKAATIKEQTGNINLPLRDVFKNVPKNISKEMLGNYLKWKDKNPLQIVCHENGLKALDCVRSLLTYKADPLYEVMSTEKTAVHYAAEGGNIEILTELLEKLTEAELLGEKLNNIFYTLIKYINFNKKKENKKSYERIFTLLLEKNLDINIPDRLSGETPIYAAASYKLKEIVTLILNKKNGSIDLISFKDANGKCAKDLITENIYDNIDSTFTYRNDKQMLYKYIREDLIEEFGEKFSSMYCTLNEYNKFKILLLAVHKKRKNAVESLLRFGIDNVRESYFKAHERDLKYHPMVLACQMGYHEIVALFVDRDPNCKLVNTSLLEVTKAPYANYKSKEIDYDKVVRELLRCKNLKINCRDSERNTSLHYAVRYQNPYMALALLNNGASMACKDANGKLPTEEMDSELIEEHLNNCISYVEKCILKKGEFSIKFTSLLPPRKGTTITEESGGIKDTNEYPFETEVLQYIGNSSELKHLLTHPVILALIYMKWHRIGRLFFADLAIHLLFVALLVILIVCNVCNVLLVVPLVLLIIILELFQIVIFRRRYLYKFDNWLKVFLSGITIAMIFFECNDTIHRQLSAIAIIMCAIELVLLLGRIPYMSTNITIFKTICWTFLTLMFWYAILLSGFAYGFHILFGGTISNNNEDGPNFFANMRFSFLKTVAMAVGELDTTSLDFNTYPLSSYLVFLIFVFFIAIVLFNLMISLAISDTEKIKNNAKIYEQKLLVDYIAQVEVFLQLSYEYLPSIAALLKRVCGLPLNDNNTECEFDPNKNRVMNKYCFFNMCTEMHLSKNVQNAIIKKLKEIQITKQIGNLEQ